MNGSERWLTFLLRVGGALTGMATLAVFLPTEWMASMHRSLGLGEYPAAPITDYLARSVSAMYALHGVLLLALSTDVRRYRAVIVVLGWSTAILGGVLLWIDLQAPMPSWWTWFEGPPVVGIGCLLIALARKVEEG